MKQPEVVLPPQRACRQDGVGAGAGGVLRSVRSLRAIAALLVLLFHIAETTGGGFRTGAAGADLFFVVSGFILWVATARRRIGAAEFLASRAIRILPLYWGVTLLMAAALLQGPGFDPAHVIASLLLVPHADSHGMIRPVFVPGWTLYLTAFFYLGFAALLRLPRAEQLWAATCLFLALPGLGLLLQPGDAVLFTYTSPLLLEFLAGLWLGQLFLRGCLPRGLAAPAAMACGLALLLVADHAGYDADSRRVLVWGVPACLILAGAAGWEASGGPFPRGRLARLLARLGGRLGDASYSLYLSHPLVLAALWTLLPEQPPPVFAVAGALACCAVALLCFAWIEQPLTDALREGRTGWRGGAAPRRARARRIMAGAVALIALGGAGSGLMLAGSRTHPATGAANGPASGPGPLRGCTILGDSIAAGLSRMVPACRVLARPGLTSAEYRQAFPGAIGGQVAIISLGANDWQGDTEWNLLELRRTIRAGQVVWLLPNVHHLGIRAGIARVAGRHGDAVIDTTAFVGSDGLHPDGAGYRMIAARLPVPQAAR
ncbi:acyltransferase family protein [Teichococcus oryzae]|uniref:Acyltransferase family protein n=1 Tax=Teichococcus oryzae TaxID=1608942 RepID=A0A5B2TG78_9PROT|nr:acyltransferase family protein [Pseudoroseomonas oryzae]KAA2212995.1 acyltransferase family protein [Pseudoroseomonas oryzae]